MSWAKDLEELRQREARAEKMGGEEKVARQHARGKMDARARLAAGESAREALDRLCAEVLVDRQQHHAHAALPERADDAVALTDASAGAGTFPGGARVALAAVRIHAVGR